jgi:hypothetical protein
VEIGFRRAAKIGSSDWLRLFLWAELSNLGARVQCFRLIIWCRTQSVIIRLLQRFPRTQASPLQFASLPVFALQSLVYGA